MVPWLIGVAPFGLVIGVSAAQADIPTLAGWLTGPTIYAGSAQVATIQMLDAGAARVRGDHHGPGHQPAADPLLGGDGDLLAGHTAVVAAARRIPAHRPVVRRRGRAVRAGVGSASWACPLPGWCGGALGDAGSRHSRLARPPVRGCPDWLRLEFLIPLFLIGEVVPKLRQVATRRAVLVAAVVASHASACPCTSASPSASWPASPPGLSRRGTRRLAVTARCSVHRGGSPMNAWTVVLVAGFGSYLFRMSMIGCAGPDPAARAAGRLGRVGRPDGIRRSRGDQHRRCGDSARGCLRRSPRWRRPRSRCSRSCAPARATPRCSPECPHSGC